MKQIAKALYVHPGTVKRAFGNRPRKRPELVYERSVKEDYEDDL